jgi:SAM-dependent methyltransferase
MRWYLVNEFENYVSQIYFNDNSLSVAMIGGYINDPEVEVLSRNFRGVKITFCGIDGATPFEYLDINNELETLTSKYDLVLCSQVAEHVWNTSNLFNLLESITKSGGYLWLSCPTSNIPHGSPDYFSAEYTPEFFANNLTAAKWDFLCLKTVGSKRNYFATHMLSSWLSKEELMRPVLKYRIKSGSYLGILRKLLMEMPGRFFLTFLKNDINSELRWATETYIFARKR